MEQTGGKEEIEEKIKEKTKVIAIPNEIHKKRNVKMLSVSIMNPFLGVFIFPSHLLSSSSLPQLPPSYP